MPVRLRQIETPEPLAIDYRPVASLIPYARNARTHSEAQVALIAGSIREYGFTNPVLVDGANGIIAGHGRVLAARKLGLASVPVIELAHLSESQRRAYVLADNRLAEAAGWDKEMLALEAADLSELGVDLASLGFEAAEIDALLQRRPDPREEATPEPPAVPVTRPGDLWLLGRHRLLCGSATDPADVARLLGGVRPHLMVDRSTVRRELRPGLAQPGRAPPRPRRTGKVLNDDRADWREAWALFPGEVAYVWHGALHATTVADSLVACGFAIRIADHLGQGAAGARPRRLPLAARALLVRGARQGQGALERRPQAVDALADRQPRPGRGDGARHPEAGRGDAPADAEQQRPRPAGLRALLRIGDLDHRRRDLRPDQPRRWSSTRPTSMSRCFAGRASPARAPTPRRRRPQLRSDRRREERQREPRPPPEADGDPPARGQPRQARLEPRRAGAARHPAALPRASLRGRPQGMATGGAHPLRDGGADQHRPRGARRLLPGLRPLGRGRGEAEGEPGALQDRLGLRAAVALARASPTSSSS